MNSATTISPLGFFGGRIFSQSRERRAFVVSKGRTIGFVDTNVVERGTGVLSLAGHIPSSLSINSRSAQSHFAAEPLIGAGVLQRTPIGQEGEQEAQPI